MNVTVLRKQKRASVIGLTMTMLASLLYGGAMLGIVVLDETVGVADAHKSAGVLTASAVCLFMLVTGLLTAGAGLLRLPVRWAWLVVLINLPFAGLLIVAGLEQLTAVSFEFWPYLTLAVIGGATVTGTTMYAFIRGYIEPHRK